jgi:hypothetical protein
VFVARADLHLIEWIVSSGLVRLGLQYDRADQLRSVFEGGVLAHQPIDGGLAMEIQFFLRVSSFRMVQLFLRLEGMLRTRLLRLQFQNCDRQTSRFSRRFPLEFM